MWEGEVRPHCDNKMLVLRLILYQNGEEKRDFELNTTTIHFRMKVYILDMFGLVSIEFCRLTRRDNERTTTVCSGH